MERINQLIERATLVNPTADACGEPVRRAVGIVNGYRVSVRASGFNAETLSFEAQSIGGEIIPCATIEDLLNTIN